jgi:hypothetical protein
MTAKSLTDHTRTRQKIFLQPRNPAETLVLAADYFGQNK